MHGRDHPRRAQLRRCRCRSGTFGALSEPGPTPRATRHVRHVRDPRLHGPIQTLRTTPHPLLATRRNHRPPQPVATVLTTSPRRPRRPLATPLGQPAAAHHHLPQRHHPNHRTTRTKREQHDGRPRHQGVEGQPIKRGPASGSARGRARSPRLLAARIGPQRQAPASR